MTEYVALNRTEHTTQGWRKAQTLGFAMSQSSLPVLLDELPRLIPTLPLAFIAHPANDGPQRFELHALFSITAGVNLYVTQDGRWLGGYLPSAFRGYPFRLLPNQNDGRLMLCFDRASELMTDTPELDGTPFYTADGEVSKPLQDVLNFLNLCEKSRQQTQQAVDLLARHKLIVPWSIRVNNSDGEPQEVPGLYRVDESALRELNGDALHALQQGNALTLAYAQLFSQHRLQSFGRLYELHQQAAENRPAEWDGDLDAFFDGEDDTLKFDF